MSFVDMIAQWITQAAFTGFGAGMGIPVGNLLLNKILKTVEHHKKQIAQQIQYRNNHNK